MATHVLRRGARALGRAGLHVRDAGPDAAGAGQRRRARDAERLRPRVLENPDRAPVARVAAEPGFDLRDPQRRRRPLAADLRADLACDHGLHRAARLPPPALARGRAKRLDDAALRDGPLQSGRGGLRGGGGGRHAGKRQRAREDVGSVH